MPKFDSSNHRTVLMVYFFLAAFDFFIGIFYLFSIPTDSKRQIFLGYSLFRLLLLLLGFVVPLIAAIFLGVIAWTNDRWSKKLWESVFLQPAVLSKLLYTFGLLCIFSLLLSLIPNYHFGIWQAYAERIRPWILVIFLFSLQTVFLLITGGHIFNGSRFQQEISNDQNVFFFGGIALAGMLLLWGVIALFDVGIYKPLGYWNVAGVPLLSWQIWFMVGIIAAWLSISRIDYAGIRITTTTVLIWIHGHKDLVISLFIWGITVFFWIKAPLQGGFFSPRPYPPNNVIYPFSDAASWDITGQFALIGEGFGKSNAFASHVGLSGFLAYLHLLVGQSYEFIIVIQVLFYAIFPVILYLLTKAMFNRLAGLFVAGLIIFHELNAIAAERMINLSHAKLLMTEFPVGLGLAVIALLLFIWLRRKPNRRRWLALPIGGILAIMIMYRFNTLIIPIAIVIGFVLVYKKDWRGSLIASTLMLFALLVVLMPWMWRSWKLSGTPFFFMGKTQLIFQSDFRLSNSSQPVANENEKKNNVEIITQVIPNYFVHNLITSVLVLPTDPFFNDLKHTLYEVHPYWNKIDPPWKGSLSLMEWMGVLINLILLSIGIGVSWKYGGLSGLIPLGIFLTYNFSTALARTSGGRYIVPVDWVVLLYFALGVLQIITWILLLFGVELQKNVITQGRENSFSLKAGLLVTVPFFLFVFGMLVLESSIPPRYPLLNENEIVERVIQTGVLEQTAFSPDDLRIFMDQPDAQAFYGMSLYPRFYRMDEGEHTAGKYAQMAFVQHPYPRLGFKLLGPFGVKDVVLPLMHIPGYFPHAVDVMTLGCNTKNPRYFQALMVVVLSEKPAVYVREPKAPLKCPLPDPVCEDNATCY